MSDQAEARAVCEHFYASHCYRGMSISLCSLCHQPDWDDLERQMCAAIAVPAGAGEAFAGEGSDGSEGGSGVALIRAERLRQVAVEGYTPEHDARHGGSQLARAAACYALHASGVRQISIYPLGSSWPWPWPAADFKPKGPLPDLVRAGALIAAEIDRLIDNG